ncbi:MAG: hypothetical protein OXQ90_21295 [Gammaproteobacteria bacterium]|nr:hypothetical protein [Gammaproteobacteria bacterium]
MTPARQTSDIELDQFRGIWDAVRQEYQKGHIVYERGLQAALYSALRGAFPDKGIVVEPRWDNQIPDIVVVESGEITDIFELKFAPHWWPRFKADTKKLLAYKKAQAEHVTLCPATGKWACRSPIRNGCRLHFAVVGQCDAAAVNPRYLPDRILLWYGRIGGETSQWDVCRGEKPCAR